MVLYAVTMVFLVLLGVSPSPVLVAAFFLAAAVVFAVFSERFGGSYSEPWIVSPPSTAGLGRGSDHRTSALARRLEARVNEPSQRRNLAAELQRQLGSSSPTGSGASAGGTSSPTPSSLTTPCRPISRTS